MPLLLSILLFLVVAGTLSFTATRFWAKPRAAVERVTGVTKNYERVTVQPGQNFRELVAKLGSLLPASPKDIGINRRRLIRAGFRSPGALKVLYGVKAILGVTGFAAAVILAGKMATEPGYKIALVGAMTGLGFFGPNEYVRRAAARRQKKIRRALPNALDLLVVCVESGLGLDQAILQSSKELEHAHPEISQEFALVNYELRAGKRRLEALRNLAERTAVDDLRKLVAVLIQADRFGTGIAQSLRAHSDYLRVQWRQRAEEKAAKLGVKLVFPIFFCILPSLFVVTVGPVAVRVYRELIPMINSM